MKTFISSMRILLGTFVMAFGLSACAAKCHSCHDGMDKKQCEADCKEKGKDCCKSNKEAKPKGSAPTKSAPVTPAK